MHRDQLKIAEPCHADWTAMSGDARRRFCGSCSKHVHDLSAMTARKAERLMAEPGDRCVRYASDADGNVVHTPSRLTRLAAVGVALLGAAPAFAAPQPVPSEEPGLVERLVTRVQSAADAWSSASAAAVERREMGDIAEPPVQLQGAVARPEPPVKPPPRELSMGKIAAPPTIVLPPVPPPPLPVMHLPTPAPGETVIAEVEEALRNSR